MKHSLLLIVVLFSACANGSPLTGPSSAPLHHNIPATMADDPSGRVYWLCETQSRGYSTGQERDHYLQTSPCPDAPIP